MVPLLIALPPWESYVTVKELAVHCAYKVKFEVCPWVYAKEMAEPPLEAANHPLNVYPDRVGLPGGVAI